MNHKWTDEEIAILEEKAEFYTKEQIAQILKRRGFNRSINAVEKKLWRLGYSLRPTLDNYSCRQIASVLCYDFSTVCRWVKLGWLKARKRYSNCYQIRTWDLKQFLQNPPPRVRKRIASLDKEAIYYLIGAEI